MPGQKEKKPSKRHSLFSRSNDGTRNPGDSQAAVEPSLGTSPKNEHKKRTIADRLLSHGRGLSKGHTRSKSIDCLNKGHPSSGKYTM